MALVREVVITGVGVVSPIGIGLEPFRESLRTGHNAVRKCVLHPAGGLPIDFGAEIADFDGKLYVKPRKTMKVMARPLQTAFAAAELALAAAGYVEHMFPPDRFGVELGSEFIYGEVPELIDTYRGCSENGKFVNERWYEQASKNLNPLWMLKYLPNMPACHIGIAHDARGPNNSLAVGDASGLLAIEEAVRVIERGHVDVMLAGGTGGRLGPTPMMRRMGPDLSRRADAPERASRPFDADRDGQVNGEGAAMFLLETAEMATARGATILARILGCGNVFEPPAADRTLTGDGVRRSILAALRQADLTPADVGHVNAHGLSTIADDIAEARGIRAALGDVPVTALKSYFGNLGAGSGAVELAGSIVALQDGQLPPTLNYERPDPRCPINVVHGGPLPLANRIGIKLSQSIAGQCAALVIVGV